MIKLAGLSPAGVLNVRAGEALAIRIVRKNRDGVVQTLSGRSFKIIVRRPEYRAALFTMDADLAEDTYSAMAFLTPEMATGIYEAAGGKALSYDLVETSNGNRTRWFERVFATAASDTPQEGALLVAELPISEIAMDEAVLVFNELGAPGDGTPAIEAAALTDAVREATEAERLATAQERIATGEVREDAQALVDAGASIMAAASSVNAALEFTTKTVLVPLFGMNDLIDAEMDADGAIVQYSSAVHGSGTADNITYPDSVIVPLFATDNLLSASIDIESGDIVEIDLEPVAEEGGDELPTFDIAVPLFGSDDAQAVSIDLDGNIVQVEVAGTDSGGSGYEGPHFPEWEYDDNDADDRVPSYFRWLDPEKYLLIFPVWGQSKADAINGDAGDLIISATPTYPGYALMPSFGTRIKGRRFSAVADLIEAPEAGCREGSNSALVNHYIRDIYMATGGDDGGVTPKVLTFTAAYTGRPFYELMFGSPTGNDLIHGLKDAAAYARSQGLIPICPALFINHGQNSTDKYQEAALYEQAMKLMRRDFNAACRAILNQAHDAIFIMTQADAGIETAIAPDTRDFNLGGANFYRYDTPIAQARLARMEGFTIACNEGWLPTGSDDLHCTNAGYYLQGACWAQAAVAEINFTGYRGTCIEGLLWRGSSVLDFEFHVPGDSALALVGGELVAEYLESTKSIAGFQFADAGGTIETSEYSVATISVGGNGPPDRFLKEIARVTFATPPVGCLAWTLAARADLNGLGRTMLTSADTYPLIHQDDLPAGHLCRAYAIADGGHIPANA